MEAMQQDNGPKHTAKAIKGKNSVMSVTWLQSNLSRVSHAEEQTEAESPQNKQEVKLSAVYGSQTSDTDLVQSFCYKMIIF